MSERLKLHGLNNHTITLLEFNLDNFFLGFAEKNIHPVEIGEIFSILRLEKDVIYYGRNMPNCGKGRWQA